MISARPAGYGWPSGGQARTILLVLLHRSSGRPRHRLLVGRLTATTAALALAGTAVVLMGQASSGPGLAATARHTPARGTAPSSATITITGTGATFSPRKVTVAAGGTLRVVNDQTVAHTITSFAKDPSSGKPYFNVFLPPHKTKSVPISSLGGGTYRFLCLIHTGMTGKLVIDGPHTGPVGSPVKFQQPLVQPPRLTGRHIRIVMRKAKVRVLPHGPKTPMWTYGGTFPGPTIVRRAGQATKVTFVNHLPRKAGSMTVHAHAGHQASRYDGQPASYLIRHGRQRTYDYPLTDGGKPLPAALRFYHDHRMNVTARNNWFGLTGMFLTTDPRDARIGLPHGRYDVPLMVTDRSFDQHHRLTNPWKHGSSSASANAGEPAMPGMAGIGPMAGAKGHSVADATVGDRPLVNGRFAPFFHVRAGKYRLQILNASLFTSYDFALSDGRAFTQVGTGDGLLPHPVHRRSILLGPAQRADVVVDFGHDAGKKVLLVSRHTTDGTGSPGEPLMQFRVGKTAAPRAHVPHTLTTIPRMKVPKKVAKTWRFGISKDKQGAFWSINGKRYNPRRVDHRVRLGSVERWRLVNTSDITHYVHLHEELWRTLSRDGHAPPPWERGYEDTWRLDPGESVEVAARFTDFTGDFMIHCHMLDHEDDGMMATFRVVRRG
jgi:spore coat protein A